MAAQRTILEWMGYLGIAASFSPASFSRLIDVYSVQNSSQYDALVCVFSWHHGFSLGRIFMAMTSATMSTSKSTSSLQSPPSPQPWSQRFPLIHLWWISYCIHTETLPDLLHFITTPITTQEVINPAVALKGTESTKTPLTEHLLPFPFYQTHSSVCWPLFANSLATPFEPQESLLIPSTPASI